MKVEKWVIFNDSHHPYQDPICVQLLLEFIRREKPYGIAILGDVVDCYQMSSFLRDPSRITNMRAELRQAEDFLRQVRSASLNAQIWYLEGNHEKRIQKYIWKQAPELAGFDELDIENLLCFNDLGIKYFRQPKEYTNARDVPHLGDLYLYHGSVIRKHAGYSARAMYEKHGVSLMCGHTHRDGKYTVRTERGHFAAWENYCLCKLNPSWLDFANWTQGFSVVTVVDNRPFVEQIPIISGSYIYGGRMYGVTDDQ